MSGEIVTSISFQLADIEGNSADQSIVNIIGNPNVIGGGDGIYLMFTQSTQSSVWSIAHNFGKRPKVSAYTVGGKGVLAEELHLSANVVQLYFDSPFAGYAILS